MQSRALLIIGLQLLGFVGSLPSTEIQQELFLTPLIKAGELEKARAQAEDNFKSANIKAERDFKSFSGYFTLDDEYKSNLFFWFFPSQQNPDKAPLILWINELPGFSSMKSVFGETGPFYIDKYGRVRERNITWTRTHSMLYIDAPAGTGFSFAEKEVVGKNDEEAAEYYESLQQFFILFPEYRGRDFYLAGENYGGSFMPYVVKYVEAQNEINEGKKINLKGFIVGSPYLNLSQPFERIDDLYRFSLIDEPQKQAMLAAVEAAFDLNRMGQAYQGGQLLHSTYDGEVMEENVGLKGSRSALRKGLAPQQLSFQAFLDSAKAHKFLHVGSHKFVNINLEVLSNFGEEFFHSYVHLYEELLDKGYRILMYSPQFDLCNTRRSTEDVVDGFKWKGTDKYSSAERRIWRVDGRIAGYVKRADNFVYAIVRNAGNYVLNDQPEWMLDLVERFLHQREF